jgi:hypothetical protein
MNPIVELFAFWQQCARHPKARLDDKRARAIAKALRWGYELADLRLAIYGCCANPWYGEGRNNNNTIYTHIGLILRDADHIDRFMRDGQDALAKAERAAREEDERRSTERDRVREIPAAARAKVESIFRRR